ncbi:MAG TPA: LD-carboxypeptidase [Caulobacterales bacterium]|nr:LD-carboxypeptidase [Caulobacterales bacterium]
MADLSGRTIRVVAPARWVEEQILQRFSVLANAAGAKVEIAPQCTIRDGQLAGDDATRAAALNQAIADPHVDIIWCARGGYGAPRLLDKVEFKAAPRKKLLVGYSDMTALHQRALGSPVQAVHAAMPFDLRHEDRADNIERAFHFCGEMLAGTPAPRIFDLIPVRPGTTHGVLVPGNLHVLATLLGTAFQPYWPSTILCVEDVGEYYYAIDRLFWRLAHSDLAISIKGIALGSFTDNEDNEIPWGKTVEQIAALHFPSIPIATDMPVGHGADNKPLALCAPCALDVSESTARLTV